jgi:ABC-type lipoprotein export system ATPase subunit
MIRCDNIHKSKNGVSIFRDISLSLSSDYITVVRGHSGCGKTTLMRCLSLLDKPDSGQIFIDNKKPSVSFGHKISVVFQQLFLWPHLNCKENILSVCPDPEYMLHLADKLNVSSLLDKRPKYLSVGQQQRIALIRALINEPKYLFLDEVTSSLDRKNTLTVESILVELQQKRNVSIFLITHNENIFTHNDTVNLLMENGSIVEGR